MNIICLHGFLGAPRDFDGLTLDAHKRLDIDLFGADALRSNEGKHAWFARLALRLQKIPSPRFLLGYSLGGRLALELIAAHPNEYRHALLLSTHPGLCIDEERRERAKQDATWAKKILSLSENEFLSAWNDQSALNDSQPLKRIPACARETLAQTLNEFSLAKQPDFRPWLSANHSLTTWLYGAKDKKFAALGSELKHSDSALDVREIPGAGHRLLCDQPLMVSRILRELCTEK